LSGDLYGDIQIMDHTIALVGNDYLVSSLTAYGNRISGIHQLYGDTGFRDNGDRHGGGIGCAFGTGDGDRVGVITGSDVRSSLYFLPGIKYAKST
jgi:hypothetical protein